MFISPLLLLAYPIDLFLSAQLKKSNEPPGEYEVMNDIYAGELHCDLAIYGSSRAWVHINPETIEKETGLSAYNFGIDGHNFWMQYLRHLEYLKYNKKPSIIIMSVDVYTFQKEPNLYYKEQFLPYMLWNKSVREYTASYNGFSALDYYVPAVRYIGERDAVSKSWNLYQTDTLIQEFRTRGFKGMQKSWNKDFEHAKAKQDFYNVEIHEPSIALFKQFIEECKLKNISVIMVYTPEHVFGQDYISNREDIFNIFYEVRDEKRVLFLDYSITPMCSDTSYFYNASHLNLKGTEVFNEILVEDLTKIISYKDGVEDNN